MLHGLGVYILLLVASTASMRINAMMPASDYPDHAVSTCIHFEPMTDRVREPSKMALKNFLESAFSGNEAEPQPPYGFGHAEIEIVEFEQKDRNAKDLVKQTQINLARLRKITEYLLRYRSELSGISVTGRLARNVGTDIAWSLCPPNDGYYIKVRRPAGPAKKMCPSTSGCGIELICMPEGCLRKSVRPLP